MNTVTKLLCGIGTLAALTGGAAVLKHNCGGRCIISEMFTEEVKSDVQSSSLLSTSFEPPKETQQAAAATTPVNKTDAWWQERHNSMNARVKQGAEKGDIGVLFIGDSITQGWEGEGKQVWEERFAKRGAVNLGIGGDKTQHVLWRLRNGNLQGLAAPKSGNAPKVAIIMIGTNNVADTQPAETAAGIAAIVKEVRSGVPGIKVILLAIFPREEKPGFARERNNKVNEIIKTTPDVTYLDIGAKLMNADGTISRDVMPDYLHLSPKGYAAWADAIEPALAQLLGEQSK